MTELLYFKCNLNAFNGDFDLICSECKFVMLLNTQKLPGD